MSVYRLGALGGTFDHFHLGHQHLLQFALGLADQLIVGVVSNPLPFTKIFPDSLEAYSTRVKHLEQFATDNQLSKRLTFTPLTDVYGPTLSQPQIDLLVVSPLTLSGGQQINQKRAELNLPALSIKVTDLVTDQTGIPISSSRIRQGLINRQGEAFIQAFTTNQQLLTDQRYRLKPPQGDVYKTDQLASVASGPHLNVLIGDQITRQFYSQKLPFQLAIVDGKIQRRPAPLPEHHFGVNQILSSQNPAGTIGKNIAQLISQTSLSTSTLIIIDGEEDLLVFPALLLLPLKTRIFYGQPEVGAVMITVTETSKQAALDLMRSIFVKEFV